MNLYELIKTLQIYEKEIGSQGSPPHGSFKGDVTFWLGDQELVIEEIEPQRTACACWVGVTINMRKVEDDPQN